MDDIRFVKPLTVTGYLNDFDRTRSCFSLVKEILNRHNDTDVVL